MGYALEREHDNTRESREEKALREKFQRELEPPSRKSKNDTSEGNSGKNGDGESQSCPETSEKPQTVGKEKLAPPGPKAFAKMMICGILLAIVLTIAGVTYHNSCSKGANLQASAVEQPQNPLHDTVGGTVGNPVEYTGGNVHESQEYKWENKNTGRGLGGLLTSTRRF